MVTYQQKNNISKNDNESSFEQVGNAIFHIMKCFFKEYEYVILQQYAIGQIPKHLKKFEKIYMRMS
jgi:hypothetical protein